MGKLRNRQHEAFCREYVTNGYNGTKAAKAAGCGSGASTTASIWLRRPEILARVDELTGDVIDALQPVKEELLAELNRLAMFDPRSLYDENGNLLKITEMSTDAALSVEEIELDEHGYPVKIKAGKSKIKALETALKTVNAFENHQASRTINIVFDEKDRDA